MTYQNLIHIKGVADAHRAELLGQAKVVRLLRLFKRNPQKRLAKDVAKPRPTRVVWEETTA